MAVPTESELLHRARQGDAAAFEALIRRHDKHLYRVARSVLLDDQEAEDAVQETYVRVFIGLRDFRATASLPLGWLADRPVVRAAVADGPHAFAAHFAVATGADTAVRLSDALAASPSAGKPKELYPGGVLRPRLRALSFADGLSENLPAGLVGAEDPALAGQIGAPLLARYRLRFDFPRGRLLLAPHP